jgi:hypothetical protein
MQVQNGLVSAKEIPFFYRLIVIFITDSTQLIWVEFHNLYIQMSIRLQI